MKFAIITEGGLEMGMGHIYRCLNLAEALPTKQDIHFITKSGNTVCAKIKNSGFNLTRFESDVEIPDFLESIKANIIIVDRLEIDENFVKKIKEKTKSKIKIVIFGNQSSANRYADIVINSVVGSNFKNRKFLDKSTNTLYLYGPKYLVLRKEFYEINKIKKRSDNKKIKKILLIFGGSDPSNLTSRVLDRLLSYNENWNIDVLLGAAFEHFNELNQVMARYPEKKENVFIYKDVREVAKFMFSSDLIITSPGLSMFEAFFARVKTILICQNSFQKIEFSGYINVYDPSVIENLREIISDRVKLKKNISIGNRLKPGQGKQEIIDLILEER